METGHDRLGGQGFPLKARIRWPAEGELAKAMIEDCDWCASAVLDSCFL